MTIPRRGLQDIRTLSGRVSKATIPYMAYLRITHIELEKARRTRESESARQRVNDIAARLSEIEAEKASLLQALGEGGCDYSQPPPGRGGRRPASFKIRY
jgi:hypothetical protein